MKYQYACRLVESVGMSVLEDDGLAFTVCGGELVNGDEAPPAIARMNGWDVFDIAEAILQMTGHFALAALEPEASDV